MLINALINRHLLLILVLGLWLVKIGYSTDTMILRLGVTMMKLIMALMACLFGLQTGVVKVFIEIKILMIQKL
jgi:hypothetical protein